jgi:hypothetical protein
VPSRPRVAGAPLGMERFRIRSALSFGPWKLTDGDGNPGGARLFDDDELERHWNAWAKHESHSGNPGPPDWDETRWAYRRFELGEDPVAAFVACRLARR